MPEFSFFKWFKNVSIAKKLYSVVGIMAVLIAVELGTLYFAVNTLSSIRAFVGAEGLWSKSQKDAIYNLQQYSQTQKAEEEQAFYDFMKVPLGHHKTLVELLKETPDLKVAREGLLKGGNHPEDIDGMITLFLRFDNISYIKESLQIWSEADSVIAHLIPIAEKLHAEINLPTGQAGLPTPSQDRLDEIIKEIDPINQKLTLLENDFSYTLGEGARWLENTILKLLLAIALTVEFSGLILTYFVVRGITKGLKEIANASKSIAQKDFSVKAQVFSNDEIGALANSFNEMIAELSNSIQKRIQADQDLESKATFIQETEKRIVGIMNTLIKTTQLDFSEKIIVSDRGDELDAIAVGLNKMSEELELHLYKLKQSEEKLNDAQRLAKIGNWDWNIVDNTIVWSDELYRIFGMSREYFEATYENYLKHLHPDDREYVDGIVQQAYQDHRPFDFFHRLILPNGDERTLHGRGEVYLNNEGKIIRMIGTAQDVTELKTAEKKLNLYNVELEIKNRELESKTNFIQENEKRIVAIMDALIKTTRMDFSEKLEVSNVGDQLDAIAVGLNTMAEELEYHLHELKLSEEKLNDAQRLAKIGNWNMDLATNKVEWSNEMFNVYGYGEKRFEVNFEKALKRMLPEDIELTKARMEENIANALKAFDEKGALEFESPPATFTLVLPDGSRKVVRGIGNITLNKNGQVIKMAGTAQDITEQDKAEKKLNQFNVELLRKNKEIEQFAYAASHDLQEPLRSISNFSKLLAEKLETYPDKEVNEYMSLVSGGANRMSNLIFDLLEYSRIGKDMSKSATDCDKLVHEILIDLTAIIKESGAVIHVEKLPVIICHDLKSVFQNLILNAIKFKKLGHSPVVIISATDIGKEFLFTIEDNGIGIEKEYYDRIFIIFQRLHLRTAYAGTGIGLSLSKKIIELHGGKIWVESEFGNGSTFYFTIPKE
ncbi:PAS domain-containing protein [Algoriphagus antarcticus]|uniref:histidine kinase n=1 Tax=Algoriphagus antarcticus TaxID=238540 RepID=A0A3E0DKZ8_9BACT|nr:PAS domain-containing protein [Algoriphagus antarcticus]REG83462.1 PAS domain S-box-containing protein [Algoriphagus antarcticus]